eukprot:Sspe_Gene.48019::Locus_24734_Transcript_1_1_Confidence_1.000_Length_1839::g.48019::m.48019
MGIGVDNSAKRGGPLCGKNIGRDNSARQGGLTNNMNVRKDGGARWGRSVCDMSIKRNDGVKPLRNPPSKKNKNVPGGEVSICCWVGAGVGEGGVPWDSHLPVFHNANMATSASTPSPAALLKVGLVLTKELKPLVVAMKVGGWGLWGVSFDL